jgi:hypothetical protein
MVNKLVLVYGLFGILVVIFWFLKAGKSRKPSAKEDPPDESKGIIGIRSKDDFYRQYKDKLPF